MILLHPFLGNRLRRHLEGPDFVIAEVALTPPLILISYHAPTSSSTLEQYEASVSNLLDELSSFRARSPQGTRLVFCSDLNTQLVPHYPTVGTWTNPSERPPDLLRANSVLGAIETLGLTVISSFFDVGPMRLAWPTAKRHGDADSIIDYVAMSSNLHGYVSKPSAFPMVTTSDHVPLQLTVLTPKRDKRYRKHLMENLLPTSHRPKIPVAWQPTIQNNSSKLFNKTSPIHSRASLIGCTTLRSNTPNGNNLGTTPAKRS